MYLLLGDVNPSPVGRLLGDNILAGALGLLRRRLGSFGELATGLHKVNR